MTGPHSNSRTAAQAVAVYKLVAFLAPLLAPHSRTEPSRACLISTSGCLWGQKGFHREGLHASEGRRGLAHEHHAAHHPHTSLHCRQKLH